MSVETKYHISLTTILLLIDKCEQKNEMFVDLTAGKKVLLAYDIVRYVHDSLFWMVSDPLTIDDIIYEYVCSDMKPKSVDYKRTERVDGVEHVYIDSQYRADKLLFENTIKMILMPMFHEANKLLSTVKAGRYHVTELKLKPMAIVEVAVGVDYRDVLISRELKGSRYRGVPLKLNGATVYDDATVSFGDVLDDDITVTLQKELDRIAYKHDIQKLLADLRTRILDARKKNNRRVSVRRSR